jgi:hypothetical protein
MYQSEGYSRNYRVFGIPIVSEIELKSLVPDDSAAQCDDAIEVKWGTVTDSLNVPILHDSPWCRFSDREFYYHLPNQVKFRVTDGKHIVVEKVNDNLEHMLLFFYSNAIAAVLMQRGLTPFHVSGVFDVRGRVWLFAAPSKTGKSTTAIKLNERGYDLFTDDTALFEIINGVPMAVASYPMVRIWEETLEHQHAFHTEKAYKMRPEVNKYGIHFHDTFSQESAEIAGIIFLDSTTDQLAIEPVSSSTAFKRLRQNVYRSQWTNKLKLERQLFGLLSEVLKKVPTYVAYRPQNKDTFNEFADMIGQVIAENS